VPRFAKRFLIALACVAGVFVIILLCINLYLQSSGVQERLRKCAEQALGAPVMIRSTSYFPWSGLVLRDIAIPDPETKNYNIVQADALRIRFAWGPLWHRRFVVTECTLFQPQVIVRQVDNGDWLLPVPPVRTPEVPIPPATETPSAPASPKAAANAPSFKAELRHFRLGSGSILLVDARGRHVLFLERVDIDADISPDLKVNGNVVIGHMDIASAIKPKRIQGDFTWDGSALDFPAIEGNVAGGKLTGSYHLVCGGNPSFTLHAALDNVSLKKLTEDAEIEPGKTEGTLHGTLDLAGDPRNSASTTGKGHFELKSATLKPVDFIAKVGELLNIDELQLLQLKEARLDLTVANERVQVDDLTLKSENLILHGQGPVRFNGKMNLDAQLLIDHKLQRQLKGMLGNNFVASDDPDYRQLPFSVTGNIDSPRTDLLDKLIGIKIGSDVGGLLKNLFHAAPSPKQKDDQ